MGLPWWRRILPTQSIAHAREALPDHRVQFLTASTNEPPTRAMGYDVVASCLVLNFIPDPAAALRAMRSLAAEQAMVAVCVWDYAGGMEFLRRFWDAAVELDPAACQRDEGERFPICSPSSVSTSCRPFEIGLRWPTRAWSWRGEDTRQTAVGRRSSGADRWVAVPGEPSAPSESLLSGCAARTAREPVCA